jgi:hypothetical protein
MLEYMAASFRVVRHVRPKPSCARCERIVQSEAPSRPIARDLAGPGLLAPVLVAKYADHLPLYRQSAIDAREGVELERSTLADWIGSASALLQPLVRGAGQGDAEGGQAAYRRHACPGTGAGPRHDQDRPAMDARDDRPTGDGCPPSVLFRYSSDRKGERPQDHLRTFRGFLQADGYAGFNRLYGNEIVEVACWAHVRRKFHDIRLIASPSSYLGTLVTSSPEPDNSAASAGRLRINNSPGSANAVTAASTINVTMRPTKRTVSQVGLGEVTRCLSQVHGEWLGPAYCAGQPYMVCDLHHISLAVNLECSRPAVVGRPGHNLITREMCLRSASLAVGRARDARTAGVPLGSHPGRYGDVGDRRLCKSRARRVDGCCQHRPR